MPYKVTCQVIFFKITKKFFRKKHIFFTADLKKPPKGSILCKTAEALCSFLAAHQFHRPHKNGCFCGQGKLSLYCVAIRSRLFPGGDGCASFVVSLQADRILKTGKQALKNLLSVPDFRYGAQWTCLMTVPECRMPAKE